MQSASSSWSIFICVIIITTMRQQVMFVKALSSTTSSQFLAQRPTSLRRVSSRPFFSKSTITMMPEGPEVKTVVDQLQGGVGMRLQSIQLLSGRYVKHGPPTGFDDFMSTLSSSDDRPVDIITSWNVKGKFIYIVLDDGMKKKADADYQRSIWITLGMSGRFVSEAMNPEQRTQPRWSVTISDPQQSGNNKCRDIFYHDPRNFGTLKLLLSKEALDKKLKSLGPDILEADTTDDAFVEIVAKQRPKTNVCKFLMNQSKISGVGNYILAEGLYRACVDPFCALEEISEEQQRLLFQELKATAMESYAAQGMTRQGGSFRDVEGNKGQFAFSLQCYGRDVCVAGKKVTKETKGPHGRTIWYIEDQLFMPRIMRVFLDDKEEVCDPGDDDCFERMEAKRQAKAAARGAGSSTVAAAAAESAVEALAAAGITVVTASKLGSGDDKPRATSARSSSYKPKTSSAAGKVVGDDDKPQASSKPAEETTNVADLGSGLLELGWKEALADTMQSESFAELTDFIQQERAQGETIFPPQEDIFAALNLCPLDKVKVVVVGQDPYHGRGQGHGLSFSVQKNINPPPSLKNIFKEAQADVGIAVPVHGNLQCWAEQGVLLLNAVLTVRQGQANSHAGKGWEDFTDAIMATLNDKKENLVFLLWGGPAHKKAKTVDVTKHTVIRTSHPSPLGATKTKTPFLGSRCFSRANQALEDCEMQAIDWDVR